MKTIEAQQAKRLEIIANFDLKAMGVLLDSYPPHKELPDRLYSCFSNVDDLSLLSEEKINKLLSEENDQLVRAISRYEEVRSQGLQALSTYDLTISSSDPICALRTALRLTSNHVTLHRMRVNQLEPGLNKFCDKQLSMF